MRIWQEGVARYSTVAGGGGGGSVHARSIYHCLVVIFYVNWFCNTYYYLRSHINPRKIKVSAVLVLHVTKTKSKGKRKNSKTLNKVKEFMSKYMKHAMA